MPDPIFEEGGTPFTTSTTTTSTTTTTTTTTTTPAPPSGEGTVATGDYDVLSTTRQMDKYVTWIKQEFYPLTLATPDITIEQLVENAIRYWNTNSAYKLTTMFDYAQGEIRTQLNAQFKSVVQVFPAIKSTWIWNDNPLWTMLGVTIIDNVTSDLIMMGEAYRNYRVFMSADMRWTFEKSEDPAVGGYLYIKNLPSGTTSVAVVGTKRVTATEDIKQEYILDWILRYSRELVRYAEGNTLRKSGIIDIKNDGSEMITEAKEEIKSMKQELIDNSRWVAMAFRA